MTSIHRPCYISAVVLLSVLVGLSYSEIRCKACSGVVGSNCHLNPEKESIWLNCPEKCVVFAQLYKEGNKLHSIQRDCANRIFPHTIPSQFENTCKDDNAHFIECTHTCRPDGGNTTYCNDEISWNPPGWREDGSKISEEGGSGYKPGSRGGASTLTVSINVLLTAAVMSLVSSYR